MSVDFAYESKVLARVKRRVEMSEMTSFINANAKRPRGIGIAQRKRILARDKSTCQYCGDLGDVIDHVIPYNHGGSDKDKNLVTACSWCNSKLQDKFFDSRVEGKRLFISERLHLKHIWFRKRHSICGDCKSLFRPNVMGASNLLCAECYRIDSEGINGSLVPETRKEREEQIEKWNSTIKEEEPTYDVSGAA